MAVVTNVRSGCGVIFLYLAQTPQNHSGEKMSNMISGLRCHMDGGLPPLSSIKYLSTFVKMTRRPQMGDMSDCLFPGFQVRPKNSVSSSLRTRTCTRQFFMFTEQTSLELSPKYQLYLLLKVMDYLPILISWGNHSSLWNTSRGKNASIASKCNIRLRRVIDGNEKCLFYGMARTKGV